MTGVIAACDAVFDDGLFRIARIAPPPDGLVLTGEADETECQALVKALAQLPSRSGLGRPAEVHLEVSGLELCSAAALHVMIAPAAAGDRLVVLHHPMAGLLAMIRVAGWCELPGVVVAG